ncbi:MAG: S46 family peptidase [Acidobacteriota bacterium]|nr:S46 family peptidase [Acidobacteriota bacterium]
MRLRNFRFGAAAALSLLLVLSQFTPFVLADEGMFMPDKIATLNLPKKGLKIRPEEIYNPAGGGLSEAIVRLSIGCTGEFVSPDGLILTNHHCAYDALVAASTPQANYGEIGYKADSRTQELPAKGYAVTLTLRSQDVTNEVTNGITAAYGTPERAAAVRTRIQELEKADQATAGKDVVVRIQPMNDGAFYYKFHYLTVKDVRIAYAPPKNIGFYGGDPDNFEWTRHAGDFTFMRAYVAPDGSSAEYSTANIPYKPKKFLTISTEPIRENDFQFVLGYPGSTTRYRESWSVAYNQDIRLPFYVDYFDSQIAAYEEAGRANEEKRVKYQGEIFSIANSRKAFDGGVIAMRRADVLAQKRADEQRFAQWINADPARKSKYGSVLTNLERAYTTEIAPNQRSFILQLLPNGQSSWQAALFAALAALEREKPEAQRNPQIIGAAGQLKANLGEALSEREPIVERQTLEFFLRRADQLPANQRIAAFDKRFANLQGDARRKAQEDFVRVATEDKYTTATGLAPLFELSADQMRNSGDTFVQTMLDLAVEIQKNQANTAQFNQIVTSTRPLYLQGMSEMKAVTPYPDANSTQRFTFGYVKGYSPREAIIYQPFTTLAGVMEKDTGREPFNAPAKLRELWQRKDYGNYAVNGDIPVNFLNTTDIIGGNSGSPVLNARGEQVGIVFDGNYEGLGNDFFVNPALGRTIAVDIRYVLFVTDKFGGAGWILNEMNIKR